MVTAMANAGSQPSTIQNIYSGVAARLSQAKNAASNLLFPDAKKEANIPKAITLAQASSLVQKLINEKPKDGGEALEKYWRSKSFLFLTSAKLLPAEIEKQIFKALQEIDKRLIYWLYQKEHQWQYFFGKNPLKWITGKNQEVEIDTNIEQLQVKQDELYTRLGELSAIDWHQYLVAMGNDQVAYAWIEKLLKIVSGIKEDSTALADNRDYDAIVNKLNEELKKAGAYGANALSSIEETAMPYHITRNWVRYGALLMAGNWAYNNPDVVANFLTLAQEKAADVQVTFYTNVEIAKNLIEETFFGGGGMRQKLVNQIGISQEDEGLLVHKETPEVVGQALDKFMQKHIGSVWKNKPADQEKRKEILAAFYKGNPSPFMAFYNEQLALIQPALSQSYIVEATALLAQVLAVCSGTSLQIAVSNIVDLLDQQTAGVRNIALLAPAALGAGVGGYGLSKVYGRLTRYDYTPIRLALLTILSLFVDTTKPLDDLDYGKMIFLIYNLKEKARRELPVKGNVRNDFIKDLERVESREFDSAAKRRIIKDMFKKYSFLGLVQ